ncbi:MAG: flippase-like domain-containing protein, partial [Polyangiaceae bacterium]|nr:flippase-like domain-containing protein [Polyangiaceae bacterium]
FLGIALCARRGGLRPVGIGRAMAWSLAADAVEVGLVAVTLDALGMATTLGVSLAVLGAVNLAIVLPSAPGHAGAIEAGAALALVALGASHERAVAFALLYRIVQWVPVTAGGGIVWVTRALRGGPRAARTPTGGAMTSKARGLMRSG